MSRIIPQAFLTNCPWWIFQIPLQNIIRQIGKSVVKTIYDYGDFGPELNKTGYFEQDITALLEGKNTKAKEFRSCLIM